MGEGVTVAEYVRYPLKLGDGRGCLVTGPPLLPSLTAQTRWGMSMILTLKLKCLVLVLNWSF